MLGALSLLAAACGVSREGAAATVTAATVEFSDEATPGSISLSQGEVATVVDQLQGSTRMVDLAFRDGTLGSLKSDVLTLLIYDRVLDRELMKVGIEAGDPAIDLEFQKESLRGRLATALEQTEDDAQIAADEVWDEASRYLELTATVGAKQQALGDSLAASLPEAETVSVPCSSHILVESFEEANGIISELSGGADFGEIAKAVSLDPGSGANGGSLGCSDPGGFVPEFRDAILEGEVDEIIGPIETQFGFHIIQITSYEDVAAAGSPDPRQLSADVLTQALTEAVIVIGDVGDIGPATLFWDGTNLQVSAAG